MLDHPIRSTTATVDIYIKLAQYPILSDKIRAQMRQALYERGVLTEDAFEREVEERALESQKREGLYSPYQFESFTVWEERSARIRNFQTDFHFAYNLPQALFEQIVGEALKQINPSNSTELTFNPEIAPWRMLFEQGQLYEALPAAEREPIEHHLEEIKVVLIRGMITDQLPLIAVAKRVLSIADLQFINERRIGEGKIGGKSTGMLIAWKILQQHSAETDQPLRISIPESFFIGTNVMYDFRAANDLEATMNQKYKPLDQIRTEYPHLVELHLAAQLPHYVIDSLQSLLSKVGNHPIIVRSSSLLEDNFGTAFAGKYDSIFCPNQGSPDENIADLMNAIKRVYACTLNPDALLYRRRHGLIDYDERMAILIQEVSGEQFGDYWFPALAGVGFSQNPFRWHPKIEREKGFLRLVWGMGTRAVDRVSADYPRLIALSHPQLRPETTARAIRQYSQHQIDLINLRSNQFETLAISDLPLARYPHLRFVASTDEGGYLRELFSNAIDDPDDLLLTFNTLTKNQRFVALMRDSLMQIEATYGTPVDVEFAVKIIPGRPKTNFELCLLQCRPLNQRRDSGRVQIPDNISAERILFTENRFVPNGKVEEIRYLVFVDPEKYRQIPNRVTKLEIGRVVSRLNKLLENEIFILIGPGRWGSTNLDLGVKVGYADIYNTKVLIEMAVKSADGGRPELSYGTHFFQDLVEAGIYSLPLHLDHPRSRFQWEFFHDADNQLDTLLPED
ncbi:MAG: PEP/pyruvate-binding domain-containing protein, partial [Candidatus Promineifilaceae bacterium]